MDIHNANNRKQFYGQSILVSENEAREFWTSQNDAVAENELVELLSKSAKPTNDPDLIAWAQNHHLPLFKSSLNVAYVRANDKFVSKPVGSRFWCGLAEKAENSPYWDDYKTDYSYSKFFWGIIVERPSRHGWQEKQIVIENVNVENQGPHDDILVPKSKKVPPNARLGSFVVGKVNTNPNSEENGKLEFICNYFFTPFMIRTWDDFAESDDSKFSSLDAFIEANKCSWPISITPKFQTKYSKILIHSSGKLYSGFKSENGIFTADSVKVSYDVFKEMDSFADCFYTFNFSSGAEIHFADDEFLLINPDKNKWESHDKFLQDSSFWIKEYQNEPAKPTPPSTGQGNQDEEEREAILFFWNALKAAGWNYTLRDIVRFHTSVRCEPLTLLGGAPGSGKSSLARMYASFFGLGSRARLLQIDVQPSWHDRMDFLGFVKTHGDASVFVEAETGMISFLKQAETAANTSQGLWLICLEEINLARPEHYFADFLQRMSLTDLERLENPIVLHLCEGVNKTIAIVPTVRFVGTCNFDETTQNFSARFWDRCNYIELQPPSIREAFFPEEGQSPHCIEFNSETCSKWHWHPWDLSTRTRTDSHKEDVERFINETEELFERLGILPSPRVISSLVRYIEARLPTGDVEQDEELSGDIFVQAFDEALVQRVLPKLFSSQRMYPATGNDALWDNLSKKLLLGGKQLNLCATFLGKMGRDYQGKMIP